MPPWGHAPFGTKRADALRLLAEAYLERRTEPRGSVADRFQVAVHIDQRLLARGARTERSARGDALDEIPNSAEHAAPELEAQPSLPTLDPLDHDMLRHCELEGADRPLAIETARRLACDATLVGIVEAGDGTPLDVGRRTRAIPPALQRALRVRDGGCRFPGCGRTRFTEGHHVVHWADGGETKLDNLVTLCRFHHRLIHEGGYGLHLQNDCAAHERFVFTRPDGTRIEPNGRWRLHAGVDIRRYDDPLVRRATHPDRDSPAEQAAGHGGEAAAEQAAGHGLLELNRERGLEIEAPKRVAGRHRASSGANEHHRVPLSVVGPAPRV